MLPGLITDECAHLSRLIYGKQIVLFKDGGGIRLSALPRADVKPTGG
jgi:hypothetical protein